MLKMSTAEDLVTDLASIVTSVRPREIMTIKRIEEDYKAIYGNPIPFYDYGYASVSDLLENFPNHFKFSMADGMLVVRTKVKNRITALIEREKSTKKSSKNFGINGNHNSTSLFKKHKRREMKVDPDLPGAMIKSMTEMIDAAKGGIHKHNLLTSFREHAGYECKYQDYGFGDQDELMQYLNGRAISLRGNFAYKINDPGPSLFDLLKNLLKKNTGYTISTLQDHLSSQTTDRIPIMMKSLGHVNFIDVIYDAHAHDILCYDQDLVYSPSERRSMRASLYPGGVSTVKIVHVVSPSNFLFEIVENECLPDRASLHREMQRLTPNEPLLSMFKDNRHCSVEYDGEWYRARITEICCDKGDQSVKVVFEDFPLEVDNGINVSLPTDRLRFVPERFEDVPNYMHMGSLAYICAEGCRPWGRESCEAFQSLATVPNTVYRAFLVGQTGNCVSVDLVAVLGDGEGRCSLFQRMLIAGLAQSALEYM